jgi:hypothetical protein
MPKHSNADNQPSTPADKDLQTFDPWRRTVALGTAVGAAVIAAGTLWAAWPDDPGRASPPVDATRTTVAGISATEAEVADRRGQLCTAANAVGVGLRGEYFSEPSFQGQLLVVRTEDTLEYSGSLALPPSLPAPGSVRWSGWLKAPMTGRFRFHVEPVGMTIQVGTRKSSPSHHGAEVDVELAAGRFYPVTVEWPRVNIGAEMIRLQWTAPHGARYTIPQRALFLPTETVANSVAATNVR